LDGATLDVADTAANQAAFGRAKSGRGEGTGAFPQVRLVGLVEGGTHATIAAAMGPYATGEQTLAGELLVGVGQGGGVGMLLLADRLFVGAQLWRQAAATGAALLWRAKTGTTAPKLPVDRVLSDGSWLSRRYAASDRRRRHPTHGAGDRVHRGRPGPADQHRPLPAGDHDLGPHRRARR